MSTSIDEILNDPRQFNMLVEAAFKSVDKDGSGYLEMEELKLLMGSIATALGVEVRFV